MIQNFCEYIIDRLKKLLAVIKLNRISHFETECGMYMSRNREGNRLSIVEWENETAGILTERTDDSGIFD